MLWALALYTLAAPIYAERSSIVVLNPWAPPFTTLTIIDTPAESETVFENSCPPETQNSASILTNSMSSTYHTNLPITSQKPYSKEPGCKSLTFKQGASTWEYAISGEWGKMYGNCQFTSGVLTEGGTAACTLTASGYVTLVLDYTSVNGYLTPSAWAHGLALETVAVISKWVAATTATLTSSTGDGVHPINNITATTTSNITTPSSTGASTTIATLHWVNITRFVESTVSSTDLSTSSGKHESSSSIMTSPKISAMRKNSSSDFPSSSIEETKIVSSSTLYGSFDQTKMSSSITLLISSRRTEQSSYDTTSISPSDMTRMPPFKTPLSLTNQIGISTSHFTSSSSSDRTEMPSSSISSSNILEQTEVSSTISLPRSSDGIGMPVSSITYQVSSKKTRLSSANIASSTSKELTEKPSSNTDFSDSTLQLGHLFPSKISGTSHDTKSSSSFPTSGRPNPISVAYECPCPCQTPGSLDQSAKFKEVTDSANTSLYLPTESTCDYICPCSQARLATADTNQPKPDSWGKTATQSTVDLRDMDKTRDTNSSMFTGLARRRGLSTGAVAFVGGAAGILAAAVGL
ncbi:hypothetical protein CC78DRAFT_385026 [Lojkania enalia]|uniref:Uncharacterized protein n=1 Tax=Lojkania enalia TaxID=147567 RepID=A0A9P4K0Y8_9PLEO|nr:hypothetical protein CC78DRAFT_385026 [Didymosphaeria enalia]